MTTGFNTPDELASALFVQQGYLVIAGFSPLSIGEVVPAKNGTTPQDARNIDTRLRVIAPANYEEWRAQCLLSGSLLGHAEQIDRYPYYHRCEGAD